MERIVLPKGKLLYHYVNDPTYRDDLLNVAGGYAEQARRIEEAGDWPDAANWWLCAGALYLEAARVCQEEVAKEGHLAAAAECERHAHTLTAT